MPVGELTATGRVAEDKDSGVVRSWFDPVASSTAATTVRDKDLDPHDVAAQVLRHNAAQFGWDGAPEDLRDAGVVETENAYSVRYRQVHEDVPVDGAEVVVNMYGNGTVYSVYNNYDYDIPEGLNRERATVDAAEARRLVLDLADGYEGPEVSEPVLTIYRHQPGENRPPGPRQNPERLRFLANVAERTIASDERVSPPRAGEYFLVWDVRLTARRPSHAWRVLVDATSGRIVAVKDLAQYATGQAKVFDPNPIVTSGDLTLFSGTPVAILNMQQSTVALDRLDPPQNGSLHLDGQFVQMEEFEKPTFAEPGSATGDFRYGYGDRNFLDAMVYFHVDRMQEYIQTVLGLTTVANFSIGVDPQGVNGDDNSHYLPGSHELAFGEGGIPDAADAMVILHEYGHAIQDNALPGFDNPLSGVGEGFGDFLAAVFYDDKHANPGTTRGFMMSWDANPTDGFWPGRRYDVAWLFDGPEYNGSFDNHTRGQLWCATMFELYRKLGGDSVFPVVRQRARDLAIRLHLMANFHVPTIGATAGHMGQEVEAADRNVQGWRYPAGLHRKVIYDTFRRRHLAGYPDPAVDVFVDDGRGGGYGSASGNDLFGEQLWDEDFWDTRDIWVRTAPYPNSAAQAAGGPADHVEPPVGSTAYLYARVKNRGTAAAGSGPVTVRAFHSAPNIGLVWPVGWTPMNVSALQVANIVPGAGEVVGPFTWTPTEVGHECVLVVVECDSDRSITQDLPASALVAHADLVPFDNNIAQRNLVPTAPGGTTKRGFYLVNPDRDREATVELVWKDDLPAGWRWESDLEGPESLRLGPAEQRWVTLTVDQADGEAVETFDPPFTLTVTGLIEGQIIGGMTFYIAPPSTFEGQTADAERLHTVVSPMPFRSPDVPWEGYAVEGEATITYRFRSS
jgi:zinc metalloprotease ZmpB